MSLLGAKQATTLFSEILTRVKAAGLLEKKPSFYLKRLAIFAVLATAVWVGAGYVSTLMPASDAWIVLAFGLAGLLGVLAAQFGFIAHEAAHRQIFRNNKTNDWFGLILANLFAGLSYGFWQRKHNKHHLKPNFVGEDPDIDIRVLSFTVESRDKKRGIERWISNRQGWLFPFLLFLTGFDLLLDSFAGLVRKDRKFGIRALEFSLMLVRQVLPYVLMAIFFGWAWAVALWVFMMLCFGFFMGAAFAPNHKGMPLVPHGSKIDYFQRQVLTSRNIRGSWLKDNLMGGLNYQVEHHLFPSMPRPNLKAAHKLVKDFCAEHGVPLTEMNLFASYRVVIEYLNKVGLSNNVDPFVCPMVAALKPVF